MIPKISSLIRFIACAALFFFCESSMAQGKINRPQSTQSITYRRMDQLDNEAAYRAQGSNGKYGVVDRYDNLILPCKFMLVDSFMENRSHVQLKKGGKYAIINEKGEFITDYIYDVVRVCRVGRICVGMKDEQRPGYFKFGIIDKDGKEILPMIYGMPSNSNGLYKDGKVKLSLNGKDIWFDRDGNEITQ